MMSTSFESKDRRAAPRIVDTFSFKLGFDRYEHTARTVNISTSGVLCILKDDIPVMTKVDMNLVIPSRLPDGNPYQLKASGVVVRSEPCDGGYQVAVFFTNMSRVCRRKLGTHIRSKLSPDTYE